MYVLIGVVGTNNLQIPALVWSDKQTALNRCKELFGSNFIQNEADEYYRASYEWYPSSGFSKETLEKVFTNYYSGCGECCKMFLFEVEEGEPFVHWDL